MFSAASVVVCALSMLGRSAGTLPPIAFVDVPPPGVSRQADAFVPRAHDTIYLVTSAPAFQTAQRASYRCGERLALAKVASVIVHEEWHIRHGADERGAYEAQVMVLRATMGFDAESGIVDGVRAAMRATLREQSAGAPRPERVVASTDE
jgi:hypothetical protein